ncbi:MAG: hypothetical protein ACYCPS_04365 [Candidatus Saccharimonadales bacterium]
MTFTEFCEHCEDDAINGYSLRPGQSLPESYDDLVIFVAHRMKLSGDDLSVSGLTKWLMENRENEASCSPAIDTEHVTTVVLIGELTNRDEYVASFPDLDNGVPLPPSRIVRSLIIQQNGNEE